MPSLDRVLAFIRSEIGAGRGFPTSAAIACAMGWASERSARDALARLEVRGDIRLMGMEERRGGTYGAGRRIYEITLYGSAPRSKSCRACVREKPAGAYHPSRHTADGLASICRECTARGAAPASRRARRAPAAAPAACRGDAQ
jgi:hypothetical protein